MDPTDVRDIPDELVRLLPPDQPQRRKAISMLLRRLSRDAATMTREG